MRVTQRHRRRRETLTPQQIPASTRPRTPTRSRGKGHLFAHTPVLAAFRSLSRKPAVPPLPVVSEKPSEGSTHRDAGLRSALLPIDLPQVAVRRRAVHAELNRCLWKSPGGSADDDVRSHYVRRCVRVSARHEYRADLGLLHRLRRGTTSPRRPPGRRPRHLMRCASPR